MRMTTLKTVLAISIFSLITAYTATGKVIYVDIDATGINNGWNWANAFNYLQEALSAASSGDEIRVAQGTYKPNQFTSIPPPSMESGNPEIAAVSSDREKAFHLMNGVVIRGGYAGFGEPNPDARDVQLYETILSGDLNGDDGSEFANNGENSYHVVRASDIAGATAVLDGFTITGGNANGDSSNWRGGGLYTYAGSPTISNCTFRGSVVRGYDADGGGLYSYRGSPILTNCTFIANTADDDGGGMAVYNGSPVMTNCTFTSNTAGDSGGGFRNYEGNSKFTNCTFVANSAFNIADNRAGFGGGLCSHAGNATVINCIFIANSSGWSGGGFYTYRGSPAVMNCRFIENSSGWGGGGFWNYEGNPVVANCRFIYNYADNRGGGFWNYEGNPALSNCTFIDNFANDDGGGLWNYEGSPAVTNCAFIGNFANEDGGGLWNYKGIPIVINSIFNGNAADDDGGVLWDYEGTPILTNCILWDNKSVEIYTHDGAPSITYSDVEGGWPGEGNIDTDPCFVSPGYRDVNGIWIDGDYHLLPDSPCIDTGDSSAVPPSVTTDLDGRPRIRGRAVDMGVYEGPAVFFVDTDANGANDGSSWTDAFNDLDDALAGAISGDEIRVAQGIYTPRPPEPPQPPIPPPPLEASMPPPPWFDRLATFQLKDGVVIRGGYAGFGEAYPDARDVDAYKTILSGDLNGDDVEVNDPCDLLTHPSRADNCYHVVTARDIGYYGSGPNTVFDGFTITGGNANAEAQDWENRGGGGMYNIYSSPTIINCTFSANSAWYGGGIENIGSWPDLINCTFSRNFSEWGGGMANDDSRPTLIDCTFIGNVSSYKGGAMANYDGSPPVTNCAFIGNCAVLGGAIYGADCNPKLTDCTFTGNLAEKGGAAYNNDSSIKLTNCTLSVNGATTGGVIYDDEGSSVLLNCKLSANTAASGGVIYSGDESYGRLTNCVLTGNTAVSGGVIYISDDGSVRLTYCTLADNSADNGSALACDSYQQQNPSSIEVTNCILWDSGNEIWNNDGSIITIAYSDVQGGWPGEGNIDGVPLFVEPGHWNADGLWLEGDYSLRAGSPCLDAGTDAEIYEDIEGNIRPSDFPGADNNCGLADFDMGAYEAFAVPKGEITIFPRTVNRSSRGQKISAVLYMPEPIAGGNIDMSEPLVLYPGAVEAAEQKLQEGLIEGGVSIRASFDRAEMLADMPDNGEIEVTVVGRFISGGYFYCTDKIKVVSSQR